jgi:hypothetical protein
MPAHCATALSRVTAGNLPAFTPALNGIDVAERRRWPLTDILSELTADYLEAGTLITKAAGKLDVLALGEWLHGGDIRDTLGEPLAYASDGFDDACALPADRTRRKPTPLLKAYVPGSTLTLGLAQQNRAPAVQTPAYHRSHLDAALGRKARRHIRLPADRRNHSGTPRVLTACARPSSPPTSAALVHSPASR